MAEAPQPPDQGDTPGLFAQGMRLAGVATQFAVTLGVFGYLGNAADDRYAAAPWGLLTGILLGMGLGLWTMMKQLAKFEKTR